MRLLQSLHSCAVAKTVLNIYGTQLFNAVFNSSVTPVIAIHLSSFSTRNIDNTRFLDKSVVCYCIRDFLANELLKNEIFIYDRRYV